MLTLAMMLSVMVMNTGAAFTDAADINEDHSDAVDMCVALSILNGFTDGSFQPNGDVTRAQMCKMCCVAMNGGKVPALGTAAASSFTDVALDNWASPYIEACVAQGIVAGIGGGKFNPNGQVTGTQAAKMLLIALGYDATAEGLVGAGWDVKTNVLATQKGLYDELEDIDVSAALTREHAAQMIWNCLQATEVEYDSVLTVDANGNLVSSLKAKDVMNGNNKQDALSDWYKNVTDIQTVLQTISYNPDKDEYTYNKRFVTEADYTDLLGQNVRFVYKANDDVYGAYAVDSSIIVEGMVGDIDLDYADKSIEVDDVDYDLSVNANIATFASGSNAVDISKANTIKADTAFDDFNAYDKFVAIDSNDDDDIDTFIIYTSQFGEVKYVGSDYARIDGATEVGSATDNQFEFEDYAIYEGIAKDDYAMVVADTTLKTEGVITNVEKMTGAMSGYNADTATIDGTGYDYTALAAEAQAALKNNLNKDVDFYAINGYIVKAENASSADLNDYVLLTGTPVMSSNGYYQVDALFADGTEDTITIKSLDNTKNDSGVKYTKSDTTNNFAAMYAYMTATSSNLINLYTYEVSSGKYELTALKLDSTLEGFDVSKVAKKVTGDDSAWTVAKSSADADAKIAGAKFADDAVVFVLDDGDYSVMTGADVAKITDTSTVYVYGADKNTSNGTQTVTFAYIRSTGATKSDLYYGFVTSGISTSKDGTDIWKTFDVYGVDGTVTVNTTENVSFAKGDVIQYRVDGDEMVDVAMVPGIAGVLSAFDGDEVTVNGTVYDTDDDETDIFYVNSDPDKNVGDDSGYIQVAEDIDSNGADDANVFYYVNGGKLVLLVVDSVNNQWKGNTMSVPVKAGDSTVVINPNASTGTYIVTGNFTAHNSFGETAFASGGDGYPKMTDGPKVVYGTFDVNALLKSIGNSAIKSVKIVQTNKIYTVAKMWGTPHDNDPVWDVKAGTRTVLYDTNTFTPTEKLEFVMAEGQNVTLEMTFYDTLLDSGKIPSTAKVVGSYIFTIDNNLVAAE